MSPFRTKNLCTSNYSVIGSWVLAYGWHILFEENIQFRSESLLTASLQLKSPLAWQKTPVESRELNRPCYIGGFYDYHDFWHFLSAAAVFTSFMVLDAPVYT